jgi:hypothetical protein
VPTKKESTTFFDASNITADIKIIKRSKTTTAGSKQELNNESVRNAPR